VLLSAGQRGDVPVAPALIGELAPRFCIADTAYDSNAFRELLIARGTRPVIPNNPTRKRRHSFDAKAYRRRNVIERTFSRLKDFRRIATRYDKLAVTFLATVTIASIVCYWL
jgi:transposase